VEERTKAKIRGPREPELRHIRTLERRLAHLDGRLQRASGEDGRLTGSATYDAQERDALRVALSLMALFLEEQSGQSYSTSFLLEEAAEALSKGITTLEHSDLVKTLKERARLLEELG
jgi:hypothetical protein